MFILGSWENSVSIDVSGLILLMSVYLWRDYELTFLQFGHIVILPCRRSSPETLLFFLHSPLFLVCIQRVAEIVLFSHPGYLAMTASVNSDMFWCGAGIMLFFTHSCFLTCQRVDATFFKSTNRKKKKRQCCRCLAVWWWPNSH